MKAQTHSYQPRIERGETIIWVPHKDRELGFPFPPIGPDIYRKTGSELLKRGVAPAVGDEVASLVHVAYCNQRMHDEPECETIQNNIQDAGIWIFNRNLWTDSGVYVIHDRKAVGTSKKLSMSQLEQMLKGGKEVQNVRFSKDGTIRFAPKGTYRLGEHTSDSLALDGFMIAMFGVEEAKKMSEVSERFKYQPEVFGIEIKEGKKSIQTVAALNSNWDLDERRLGVVGDDHSGYGLCCAFGVHK